MLNAVILLIVLLRVNAESTGPVDELIRAARNWRQHQPPREQFSATERAQPSTAANSNQTRECPIACPAGWNQWGPLTASCYLLPTQPVKLANFWNQHAYCKQIEPTSYPIVVNDITEQAVGTAIAMQYAASYFGHLTNVHVWLGAYVNPYGNWVVADGSNPSSVLMIANSNIWNSPSGTCLSAEPKTLGSWTPRPCNDNRGAVACEMAKRPVCDGKFGGMLPVSPLAWSNLPNLYPNSPIVG